MLEARLHGVPPCLLPLQLKIARDWQVLALRGHFHRTIGILKSTVDKQTREVRQYTPPPRFYRSLCYPAPPPCAQIRELAQQTQPSPEALRAVFSKLAGDGDRIAVLLAMLDTFPGVWSNIARSLLARVPVSLITKLICEALQERPDVDLAGIVALIQQVSAIPKVRDARHAMPADGATLEIPDSLDGGGMSPAGGASAGGAASGFVDTLDEDAATNATGRTGADDWAARAPLVDIDGPTHIANNMITALAVSAEAEGQP